MNYFRDREKREVDFILTLNNKPFKSIEVKQSDDSLSSNLKYLKDRINPEESIQLVQNIYKSKEINGIKIVSAANWLDNLYH